MGIERFFGVTTGRSGSKSLVELLKGIDGLVALHEPEPRLIREATLFAEGLVGKDEIVGVLKLTRAEWGVAKVYVEVSQKLSFVIPAIVEAFPSSRFIWLVRDGRDVVSSIYRLGWYEATLVDQDKEGWLGHLVRGDAVGDMSKLDWERLDSFGRCCWYWDYTNRLIERQLRELGDGRWIMVRLEDGRESVKRIGEFIGVRLDGSFPLVNRKVWRRDGPVGWEGWSWRHRRIFEQIAGPTMDRLYCGWREGCGVWRADGAGNKVKRFVWSIQRRGIEVMGPRTFAYRVLRSLGRVLGARVRSSVGRLYRRALGM